MKRFFTPELEKKTSLARLLEDCGEGGGWKRGRTPEETPIFESVT